MKEFTIGTLAKEAKVGVETIRFYERKGLIRQPERAKGGFRHYPEEEARRVQFIKRAQDLGFTLREIKDLLGLNADPKARCSDVKERTDQKLREIESKIKDLQKMRISLKQLSQTCGKGKRALAQCNVLDCLEGHCRCTTTQKGKQTSCC
jgi:MerR family mercuric resistance operon transcriptional regulator